MKVLDHGEVRLIETWGSDERIIEAARMSTGGGFVSWEPYDKHPKGDMGLLSYLWRNNHHTPFEMAGMTIEVKAPLMVFREWHRHRTQSYNEMSARYIPIPNESYVPCIDRVLAASSATNKQAQGTGKRPLSHIDGLSWLAELSYVYDQAERVYQQGLELGVPKELARLCLPVGRYSVMRASANLRNWLGFLALRQPSNAQWEIRQYAHAVAHYVGHAFPRTFGLYANDPSYYETVRT